MVQELDSPTTESQFRNIQDRLYSNTLNAIDGGTKPCIKGLLEIASSETVILTAIHKIKANKGANTPGTDAETLREHFLHKDYEEVVQRVKEGFNRYKPVPVRRKWIPKPGKTEMRPLGIPAIIDRIIQECIRSTIEPILEAQFFKHSYGFRPMRDAHMALNRVTDIVHKTGYRWIVEGDIKKFFDNVNHRILISQLWHLGIRDRRILCIIKEMLKAGIMGECDTNTVGTPQGGIISPLLANAYLHALDQWIIREWEEKKLRRSQAKSRNGFLGVLHKTNLKPAYFVRYADDWVLITNSKENAEKWKWRISHFLKNSLAIELSEEKTLITNVRKKSIHFVGFEFNVRPGKSRQGFIPCTRPDKGRLRSKLEEIKQNIRNVKGLYRYKKGNGLEQMVHGINILNSQIRGLIEYYDVTTNIHRSLRPYAQRIRYTGFKCVKRMGMGGCWKPANQVDNLISIHHDYNTLIPAIPYKGVWYGITDLSFGKWRKEKTALKRQNETPYTPEGRAIYESRSEKPSLKARADEMLSTRTSYGVMMNLRSFKAERKKKLYNFEFFLNRIYAYNRDKGKCRVCGIYLSPYEVHTHHIRPYLPIELVNRVNELASTHLECHQYIHDGIEHADLGQTVWNKILKFRAKLQN
ncbi:group II intron reverse transcriptase/maturase [Paenibacillus alginolyticus]|uniref:group II intron reverse transcriptase/maturase n=1 Tax=Paenibacillus alginolyticus TaxID=59839 RepID=UPI000418371C|nr:group II intron reverse transcriptase/maturase [Paenibacillus alginolyticus]MCY9665839.1 group II intron reverse transcriptase/maturase [Paenibacillus alginolyticus]